MVRMRWTQGLDMANPCSSTRSSVRCCWLKPASVVVANSTTLRASSGSSVHGTATTIAVGQSCRPQAGVGSLHPLQLTH